MNFFKHYRYRYENLLHGVSVSKKTRCCKDSDYQLVNYKDFTFHFKLSTHFSKAIYDWVQGGIIINSRDTCGSFPNKQFPLRYK